MYKPSKKEKDAMFSNVKFSDIKHVMQNRRIESKHRQRSKGVRHVLYVIMHTPVHKESEVK